MTVYFASDVHLGSAVSDSQREVERRFVAWLDRVGGDADVIVLDGDIFDFWFEYRRVVPKGFVRTLGKLASLTDRGVRILFFTGNHDMWIRDYLHTECGVEIHTAPCVLSFDGTNVFVAHGDNMNIDGKPMLKFMNTVFRSSWLRFLFSWLVHPDLAMRFGRWWSNSSRRKHDRRSNDPHSNRHHEYGEKSTEPLIRYARDYRDAHPQEKIDHYVFGHMHCPRDYREEGLHVVHLGCWAQKESYAVLDSKGDLTLK